MPMRRIRNKPSDPFFSSVLLLLHLDGFNNGTTFPDSSSFNHTITRVGDVVISTAQSKFGGSSGFFDGVGDYLTLPTSTAFNVGTGAFTVEFWFYSNGSPTSRELFKPGGAGTSNGFGVSASNILQWWKDGTGAILSSSTSIAANTWYHVAVCKSAIGVMRLFLNGVQQGSSVSNSDTFNFSGWTIGRGAFNSQWNGWIDEFRVSQIERYTANFTLQPVAFPDS